MLGVLVFGLALTPVFYAAVGRAVERWSSRADAVVPPLETAVVEGQ
jgi:hypothetical protein